MVTTFVPKFDWLIIAFLLITPVISLERRFGEPCSKFDRCDPKSLLSCQDGICTCVIPEDMTYDPTSKKCLALAGKKCKYPVNPDEQNNGGNGRQQFDYADCVPNASCNSEGNCVCNTHHVEKSNGTCVEQGGFHGGCQSSSECKSNLYLTCINGTCQCDPATAVDNWNLGFGPNMVRIIQEGRACVGLADKPCLGGQCTRGAICTKDYMAPGPGNCECNRGMVKSKGGFCGTIDFDYDAPCNSKEKRFCHSNFSCIRGKCRCKYSELHQFYDSSKELCRSFAWGPCEKNATILQCVDNAVCATNNFTGFAQCECSRGFVENLEGFCELAYGADCTPNPVGDSTLKCDQMAPLICRDGKCACEDDLLVYDSSTRKCRGLVGSLCNEDRPCTKHAICSKRYHSNVLNGKGQCLCKPSTRQTLDRTCVLD